MKIFIDSADLNEITQFYEWGLADGITTNPSLLRKAVDKRKGTKLDLESYLNAILEVAKGTPVSLEVTERDAKGMIAQGKKLFKRFNKVAGNVYIKIPINSALNETEEQFAGIEAIKALRKEKIPINCTLVFTPEQALLAAKAGANFISPFAGRIDDLIRKKAGKKFEKTDYYPAGGAGSGESMLEDNGVVSGVDLVEQCVHIIKHYGLKSEVLVASLRNPRQVREVALVGADIATLPFGVVKEMLKHEKTFEGMNNFTEDVVKEYVELSG
jgi:transaldolase